jgi:hypothetical protein
MTKDEAKEILISRKNSYLSNTEMAKAIDVAIQALTDSTPTDTALAEDVVDLCKAIQENTHSPRCWSEIEKAIRNYAAPIRAELERVRWEKELVMRQLSAANQRIAEMEKQIESNKKALASNGTISGTGTARSSARTNSLRSMYSKRLPGIGK